MSAVVVDDNAIICFLHATEGMPAKTPRSWAFHLAVESAAGSRNGRMEWNHHTLPPPYTFCCTRDKRT